MLQSPQAIERQQVNTFHCKLCQSSNRTVNLDRTSQLCLIRHTNPTNWCQVNQPEPCETTKAAVIQPQAQRNLVS